MIFQVYPLKGANEIEFGMTPMQVRQKMGNNFKLFKRGANVDDDDGTHPSDYYVEEGVFFYYSPDGYLEAIEFAPSSAPMVAGVNFFEMPMKDAVEVLRGMDPDMKMTSDTAHSDKLGVVLWTQNGFFDVKRQEWREEEEDDEDDDWEAEVPEVGSVLIAAEGGLEYLNEEFKLD